MNKTIKILSIVIIAIMLVVSISSMSFAAKPDEVTKTLQTGSEAVQSQDVTNFGSTLIGILQIAGTIAAVVILMVVGIKYMMGSAEEKAEYKKVMIPYIIGAVLLFAAPNLVRVVYSLSQNFIK